LILAGCKDEGHGHDAAVPGRDAADPGRDAAVADAGADAAPDAACEPRALSIRSPETFDGVLAHLAEHEEQIAGDWQEDFGDATAYAPPALLAAARARCDPALRALGQATLDRELALVADFQLSGEVLIGGLGLIETFALTGDPVLAEAAGTVVGYTGELLDEIGGYVPLTTVEGVGLPYGQTAVTALLVAIELRYVERVAPEDDALLAAALSQIATIEDNAWMPELGYYRYNEGDDGLYLYPNAAMMAVHVLAGHLAGEPDQLDRAEALFEAVQPLYRPEVGGFHCPYQGDSDDYISLSSQSYFLLALQLLRRERPDPRYDAAIDSIFAFIDEHLYVPDDGIAYHHWENAEHADWYCTGCNFQLLYGLLLDGGEL